MRCSLNLYQIILLLWLLVALCKKILLSGCSGCSLQYFTRNIFMDIKEISVFRELLNSYDISCRKQENEHRSDKAGNPEAAIIN